MTLYKRFEKNRSIRAKEAVFEMQNDTITWTPAWACCGPWTCRRRVGLFPIFANQTEFPQMRIAVAFLLTLGLCSSCDSSPAAEPEPVDTALNGTFSFNQTETIGYAAWLETRINDNGTPDPTDDFEFQASPTVRERISRNGTVTFAERAGSVQGSGVCAYEAHIRYEDTESGVLETDLSDQETLSVAGTMLNGSVSVTLAGCLFDSHIPRYGQYAGTFDGTMLTLRRTSSEHPFTIHGGYTGAEGAWVLEQGSTEIVFTRGTP